MKELLNQSLREHILSQISPTEDEIRSQQEAITNLTRVLVAYASSMGIDYAFILPQGSTGKKQTQLKGASDIDLFVGLRPENYEKVLSLPTKQRDKELDALFDGLVENWFMQALRNLDSVSVWKTYSQHPYLSARYMKNDVDILLCFDLPAERIAHEGPITAVDRTIHHSEYVASRLHSSLREDIRILKSFVRASHAYGDICAVGHMGFTGISLELLVIQKSGLMSALESLIRLEKEPLDPLKRTQKELKGISVFKDDCLFIIDPTDPNRNIAASFSRRAYCWIRNRAKELMTGGLSDDRIIDLIIEKQIPVSRPPEWIEGHLLIYEIIADTEKHYTIVRDKLHSFANRIARELMYERTGERRFGQVTFEIYIENERFSVGFLVENPEISQCYTRRGPPSNIPGASQFKIAHPDSYEREGYLWIEGRRRWVKAKEMLDHLITTNLPDGMEICPEMTDVGLRLANVLYQIVLPLERFPIKARV